MASTTTVQRTGADSMTVQNLPTKNYGTATTYGLVSTTGQIRYIWLAFSRAFPLRARILSAKLRMTQAGAASGGSRTISAHRITSPWSVSKLTRNNQPSVGTTPAPVSRTLGDGASGRVWEFDVTAHVQAISDGATWFGWRLSESGVTNLIGFFSLEYPTLGVRPTLEVTWALEPKAPVTLNPGSGRATHLAKPVLTFDFTDVAGDTSMDAYQVQINGTNAFTSPSFDTGEVASSTPQCDLAQTAFAGITDGASVWWRVRVKDGAGLWSTWSAATQLLRDGKGTLTITNPADAPDNVVEEATPPVSWTFTGETQRSWQVLVLDATRPSTVLADSGKRTNADTSWTIGAGVAGRPLIVPGKSYVLEVRIWDTKNRAASPGDPAYTVTQKPFSFRSTTAVTPTGSLSAEQVGRSPSVRLQWTRSAAPDSFTVLRDGRPIQADLAPEDVLVSGTTYQWIDRSADPRVQHTWTVQAVVNSRSSSSNATATATTKPRGIWLSDPDRGIAVEIDGEDDGTWTMSEQGETHTIVGSPYPVRVTQALGGYEGSVTGVLVTVEGESLTAAQKKAAVFQIKQAPSRTVWLTLADMTIPVVLSNVVVIPTPGAELVFAIGFDFFQVGELPFEAVGT